MDYYFIVWGESTSDLQAKVQEMMQFGWKPQGGVASHVSVTLGQQRFILVQAMVKFSTTGSNPATPNVGKMGGSGSGSRGGGGAGV